MNADGTPKRGSVLDRVKQFETKKDEPGFRDPQILAAFLAAAGRIQVGGQPTRSQEGRQAREARHPWKSEEEEGSRRSVLHEGGVPRILRRRGRANDLGGGRRRVGV